MDTPLLDPLVLAVTLAIAGVTVLLCLGAFAGAMRRVEEVERLRVDVVRLQRLYAEQTNPEAGRARRRRGAALAASADVVGTIEAAEAVDPVEIEAPRIAA